MDDGISIIHVNEFSSKVEPNEQRRENNSIVDLPPKDISPLNVLYIIVVFLGCIPLTLIYTLIPRKNSIYYPQYWYEYAAYLVTFTTLRIATTQLMEVIIYMNVKSLKSIWTCLKHYLRIMLILGTFYLSSYLMWTVYLENNHPMPFQALTGTIAWLVSLPLLFFWLPYDLILEKEFRTKVYFFILYDIVFFLIHQHFTALSILFGILPDNLQWVMAFIIPLSREFNSYLLSKIVGRVAGNDNEEANVLLDTTILLVYGMFVAIQLDTANDVTVYMILGVEFCLHVLDCYQIIRLQRKVEADGCETDMNDKQEKVRCLILAETVEGMIPILYALLFTTAYYGPNGTLIGNVRNGWWNYKAKEDVERFYKVMFQMFMIDVCCVIASSIILKILGRINLFQELCLLLKRYWIILMIKLAFSMLFFGYNDVNGGMDFTLNFEWLTEEGRFKLIYNATDLSDKEKYFLMQNKSFS